MKKTAFFSLIFIITILVVGFGIIAIAEAGTCGDGTCKPSEGESCASCPGDCKCCATCCCSPSAPYSTSYGCVPNNMETASGICCNGADYSGACCDNSGCPSGQQCSNHQCATSSYCGNGTCDSGESCSSCSSDCGACKKANGNFCSSGSECSSNYCVHSFCRSSSVYCGDGYCDSGESCSSCSSDCGSCGGVEEPSGSSDVVGCGSTNLIYPTLMSAPGTAVCVANGHGMAYYFSLSSEKNVSINLTSANETAKFSLYKGYGDVSGTPYYGTNVGNKTSFSGTLSAGSWTISVNPWSIYELNFTLTVSASLVSVNKKSNGNFCSSGSECSSNYCVHSFCRSSSVYCGDGYCDSGESCSSCSSDCGGCQTAQTAKKSDGDYCDKSEECQSGNCRNYRCCLSNKECCLSTNNCELGYYCSEERHYCLPGLPNGQSCGKDEQCKSGNCENDICCDWGQACCKNHSDCRENEYCQGETSFCRYKWQIGESCQDSAMCATGFCDSENWKCAEKAPEKQAETKTGAKEKTTETKEKTEETKELVFSLPDLVSIKKAEKISPLIAIKNSSQKEIILSEVLYVDNLNPSVVTIKDNKQALEIPLNKKLGPNEKVSTEAEEWQNTISPLALVGKSQGTGEIRFKTVYFVDNQAKWLEGGFPVAVSDEHVQKEADASAIFKQEMLLEEKRVVEDPQTGKTEEYVFVSPELNLEAPSVAWQKANEQKDKYLNNLEDDFKGTINPEILNFFEMIKQLNEAKTQQEITETTFRSVAPPVFISGFDLAGLIDAVGQQKTQEKTFLGRYGAADFEYVPIYDSKGRVIGRSKVIIKKENGKNYAIKIGDL